MRCITKCSITPQRHFGAKKCLHYNEAPFHNLIRSELASIIFVLKFNFFQTDPCKCQSINGWFVMIPPPMIDTNCFQLTDPVRKDVYKFRAPSADVAQVWIHRYTRIYCKTQPSYKSESSHSVHSSSQTA